MVVFQLVPQSYYAVNVLHVCSLAAGHCGVLDEGEVVGDVLVVRQPPMGPNQAVLTNRHLETAQTP